MCKHFNRNLILDIIPNIRTTIIKLAKKIKEKQYTEDQYLNVIEDNVIYVRAANALDLIEQTFDPLVVKANPIEELAKVATHALTSMFRLGYNTMSFHCSCAHLAGICTQNCGLLHANLQPVSSYSFCGRTKRAEDLPEKIGSMTNKHFEQYHEEAITDPFSIHKAAWKIAVQRRRTFVEHAAYNASTYIDIYPSAIIPYLRKYYKNVRMEDWDDQWVGEIFKTAFVQNGYCTYCLYIDSTAGMGKKI
jgi:hypothetical protein